MKVIENIYGNTSAIIWIYKDAHKIKIGKGVSYTISFKLQKILKAWSGKLTRRNGKNKRGIFKPFKICGQYFTNIRINELQEMTWIVKFKNEQQQK